MIRNERAYIYFTKNNVENYKRPEEAWVVLNCSCEEGGKKLRL